MTRDTDTSRSLWEHQATAVNAAVAEFTTAARATVVMACGTGKTLVGAEISRRLTPAGRVLIVVPTIALADQTAMAYARYLGPGTGRIIAVCSEAIGQWEEAHHLQEDLETIGGTATTDPGELRDLLTTPGRVTVISTYQSLPVVAQAHADGVSAWDLMIVDEAHRSAGRVERAWSICHDDRLIPATRRLYMTATPRIMDSKRFETVSMDDPRTFGREVYRLTFANAIKAGLLADYRLVVAVVTDQQVAQMTAADQIVQLNGRSLPASMLAAQIALLKTAQQYGLRRVITYHGRVNRAQQFAQTLHAAARLLPPQQRLGRPVLADHIHGGHPADHRRQVLRKLELAGNRLIVVSNARVLTEGVDVPELDGVMFADPRNSGVDVVQAIGRALRRGRGDGKTATIIVPVFLDAAESPDAALEGSAYEVVYRVVRALRAHDERLADELDEARIQYTTTNYPERIYGPHGLPSWLEVIGTPIDGSFARALTIRIVRMTTSVWLDGYAAAKRYFEAHGRLDARVDYVDDQGYPLGRWLAHRRYERRIGALSAERIRMLDVLGMLWEPMEDKAREEWETGLEYARRYAAREGHLRVPQSHVEDGYPLGRWISTLRVRRAKGDLTESQIAELEALGVTWDTWRDRRWEEGIAAARAFHAREGHLNVPRNHIEGTVKLGDWLKSRRVERRKGVLPEWKIEALDMLGIVWDLKKEQWERGIAAAERYLKRYGDLLVPDRYVDPEGYELGNFIAHCRARRRGTKKPPLTVEQIAQLDKLGMVWDATQRRRRKELTRQGSSAL